MSILFNRKVGLLVYNPPNLANDATTQTIAGTVYSTPAGEGIDLSEMHIRFEVTQSDIETPNTATIRIFNLKQETVRRVVGEFQRVTLQAGYDYPNGYGIIFDGTIKQVLTGHESSVDSYVEILAADGDLVYNNSPIAQTLAAPNTTPQDQINTISKAMNLPQGYIADMPLTALSRGKVLWGLAKDEMRNVAKTTNMSWSIQNGQVTFIDQNGYAPGDAVVLSSSSGLVSFPEQTPGGINILALLNPKIKIGGLLKIPEEINIGVVDTSGPMSSALWDGGRLENLTGQIAKLSGAGLYKVLVHEFEGDTRGQPWYSKLTCLAVDVLSANTAQISNPFYAGGGS